jgi:hypothetical protein
MAVYYAPKQPNYWGRAAAEIGTGLLGKFVGDMFERTAQAKEIERNRSLYSDMAQAMQGGGSRETLLDVFSKHGVDAKTAQNMINMYESPFKMRDEMGQMDIKADRVKGLPLDRNDPQGTYQGGLIAQMYGAKPEEIMKYTMPNYTAENFDAGDKEVIYIQDPVTGAITTQDHKYGLNPTKQYQSDADIKRANIHAGASKYVADVGYKGKELVAKSKAVKPAKPMTYSEKKGYNALVVEAIMTSGSPEEFAEKMKIIAGDNPEIKDYVKSVAKSSKYPVKSMAGVERAEINPFASVEWDTDGEALIPDAPDAPDAPEKPKVFSKEDLKGYAQANQMSLKDAMMDLIDRGYVIQ